jgi:uncharacterized membrane protein HdeD (DUF308 family)
MNAVSEEKLLLRAEESRGSLVVQGVILIILAVTAFGAISFSISKSMLVSSVICLGAGVYCFNRVRHVLSQGLWMEVWTTKIVVATLAGVVTIHFDDIVEIKDTHDFGMIALLKNDEHVSLPGQSRVYNDLYREVRQRFPQLFEESWNAL